MPVGWCIKLDFDQLSTKITKVDLGFVSKLVNQPTANQKDHYFECG